MTKEHGRSPSGPGSRPSDRAQEVAAVPASIPNAAAVIEEGNRLVRLCECGSEAGQGPILTDVAQFLYEPHVRARVADLLDVEAFTEAAIALLPQGSVWRRYTDEGASVYAASPYNAKAQVRYDGNNRVVSLAIAAANLKMCLAPLVKAQGTEARRAETENTGSVHDGPVAESDAPTPNSTPRSQGHE